MPTYQRLTAEDILYLPERGGAIQISGGGWANAGEIWPSIHGQVLLHQVGLGRTNIFLVLDSYDKSSLIPGAMYYVDAPTMQSDIGKMAAAGELADKLKATQNVIQDWHDFMLAAAACISGPVGWSVKGMQAAQLLAVAVRQVPYIPVYTAMLRILMDNRGTLVSLCPVLFWRILYPLSMEIMRNMPEAAGKMVAAGMAGALLPGGKALGRAIAGTLAKNMGKTALEAGRGVLKALITEVLKKVALHIVANSAKLTAEQVLQLGKHVVKHAHQFGFMISDDEGRQIIGEIERNAQPLLEIMNKLERAVSTDKN